MHATEPDDGLVVACATSGDIETPEPEAGLAALVEGVRSGIDVPWGAGGDGFAGRRKGLRDYPS